jgi:transketolase
MKRILEISYKHKLSHISSCLTTYPILKNIYENKNKNDIVILSAGHAGLAQYVIIEEYSNFKINAEDLLNKHGIHPVRDLDNEIYVSSGSLGSGILIAVGMALANKNINVYCILSDGECAEGTVWEALASCVNLNIKNLFIHVNINGYSAYNCIDRQYLEKRLLSFCPFIIIHQTYNPPYLKDLSGHYYIMENINEIDKILDGINK